VTLHGKYSVCMTLYGKYTTSLSLAGELLKKKNSNLITLIARKYSMCMTLYGKYTTPLTFQAGCCLILLCPWPGAAKKKNSNLITLIARGDVALSGTQLI